MQTRIYPQHVFGGQDNSPWTDVPDTDGGLWWSGSADISALPAGTHRLQLRVTGADGSWSEVTRTFDIAPDAQGPRERWRIQLNGSVQGALARYDELLIAGTTSGDVEAFRLDRRNLGQPANGAQPMPRPAWRTRLGGLYRAATFTGNGRTVLVGSTDYHLYALDARTGDRRWRYRTDEPVLCTPLVTVLGGVETVLFTAGFTLYALEASTGRVRWTADLHGFSAGQVACDGQRVYAGSGDGKAYAFDAATGGELWSFATNTRATEFQRLINGPWDNVVTLLPGGLVLVSTVGNAHALDRATGTQRYAIPGGHLYAPAVVTESGLVLIDERGRARRVDPVTGTPAWQIELGVRVFNAGPVVRDATIWVVAATGQLIGLALAPARSAITSSSAQPTPSARRSSSMTC